MFKTNKRELFEGEKEHILYDVGVSFNKKQAKRQVELVVGQTWVRGLISSFLAAASWALLLMSFLCLAAASF